MPRHYRKEDVDIKDSLPAVNVKAYDTPSVYKIAEHFNCSEDQAGKACEFAFNSTCEMFWEQIGDTAEYHFGDVNIWSAGRSGSWLVVEGLPNIDSWDAVQLAKWRKFEREVKAEVKHITSFEAFADAIEANDWHKDGAELYNFVDTPTGTKCIADMKAEAISAGFAAVVRR